MVENEGRKKGIKEEKGGRKQGRMEQRQGRGSRRNKDSVLKYVIKTRKRVERKEGNNR